MTDDIQFKVLSRHAASYAEIRLNRPAKGNALTLAMLEALETCVQQIAHEGQIRAVVLRGEGRFFSTGGDIAAWGALAPEQMRNDWILRGIRVFEGLSSLRQPVIAAISGHAFGGGLELAMAADLRLAEKAAKFAVPEVKIGMVAGWGGVRRLTEVIGVSRARHLALLGEPISAEQALSWGLITGIAEGAEPFEAAVNAWLDRLLANAPLAMGYTKRLLASAHADFSQQHAEAAAQALVTHDCAEGVRAFAEKRPAVFTGA